MTKNNVQLTKEQKQALRKERYEAIMADLKNPVKKAVRARKVATKATSLFRTIIFIGLSFVILFPIFQQVMFAFRDPIDLNNPLIIWIPENWSIVNFKIAMGLTQYWKSLLNNFKVSTISTIFQLASTALAGYAFARLKFKGSNILFWMVMLTLIIPPHTIYNNYSNKNIKLQIKQKSDRSHFYFYFDNLLGNSLNRSYQLSLCFYLFLLTYYLLLFDNNSEFFLNILQLF